LGIGRDDEDDAEGRAGAPPPVAVDWESVLERTSDSDGMGVTAWPWESSKVKGGVDVPLS
jgi:hypothetical protein